MTMIDYTRFNGRSLRTGDTNALFVQRGVSMGNVLDPEGAALLGVEKLTLFRLRPTVRVTLAKHTHYVQYLEPQYGV